MQNFTSYTRHYYIAFPDFVCVVTGFADTASTVDSREAKR